MRLILLALLPLVALVGIRAADCPTDLQPPYDGIYVWRDNPGSTLDVISDTVRFRVYDEELQEYVDSSYSFGSAGSGKVYSEFSINNGTTLPAGQKVVLISARLGTQYGLSKYIIRFATYDPNLHEWKVSGEVIPQSEQPGVTWPTGASRISKFAEGTGIVMLKNHAEKPNFGYAVYDMVRQQWKVQSSGNNSSWENVTNYPLAAGFSDVHKRGYVYYMYKDSVGIAGDDKVQLRYAAYDVSSGSWDHVVVPTYNLDNPAPQFDQDKFCYTAYNLGNLKRMYTEYFDATHSWGPLEAYAYSGPKLGTISHLAARARVMPSADGMLALGFIVQGSGSEKFHIWGQGPSLPSSVGTKLADPKLVVTTNTGTFIASNEDWGTLSQAHKQDLSSSGHLPSNQYEPALVLEGLAPGAYSVRIEGAGSQQGVALIAIWDQNPLSGPSIVQMSNRHYVGSAASDSAFFSFRISGDRPKRLLATAWGNHFLSQVPLNGLPDPEFTLLKVANNLLVAENDNWPDFDNCNPGLANSLSLQGITSYLQGSLDPAFLYSATPGDYIVQITGNGAVREGVVLSALWSD